MWLSDDINSLETQRHRRPYEDEEQDCSDLQTMECRVQKLPENLIETEIMQTSRRKLSLKTFWFQVQTFGSDFLFLRFTLSNVVVPAGALENNDHVTRI